MNKKLYLILINFITILNAREFDHDGGEYTLMLSKAHMEQFQLQRSDGKPGAVSACGCPLNEIQDQNFWEHISPLFQLFVYSC